MKTKLLDLQSQLLATLCTITTAVEESVESRCPYHALDDRCTLTRGCINQRRVDATPLCSGAPLNSQSP